MPVRFLILCLWSVACLSSVSGLQPDSPWESFGRDQGLSGSSVTGIAQDAQGFLWFSTQSGLNRWDGYTMRVWQKEPFSRNTLSHNLIQTLYMDGGKTLWLGTYNGLDRFDVPSETFRSYRHRTGDPSSLSHNVVTRIYRDSQRLLWVGTLDGLNRLDEKSGIFRTYFSRPNGGGLSGPTVRTLVEDDQGTLWVGTSGGLDRYDAAGDRFTPASFLFPQSSPLEGAVMAATRVPGDSWLWLAVWNQGLVHFDPQTGRVQRFRLDDNRVFSLDVGEPGELLAGTWGGGLQVFHPGTGQHFSLRHDPHQSDSLAHNVVYGTFRDRGGLLWVATNGGGVSRYNPRRKQFQTIPTAGKVSALYEARDGSLWAGVYNAGLWRIDAQGGTRSWVHDPRDPTSISNDIVNGITEDAQGNLWVVTNEGVNLFDPGTGKFQNWSVSLPPGEGIPDEVVHSLTIDSGGSYWFGTYRSGLVRKPTPGVPGPTKYYRYDPRVPGSLPDNLVYFVREDREKRLWVGTNGGLALYRPATDDFQVWQYDANNPRSLPSNTVRSLLEDTRGRIWVGTNGGGLSLLDPSTGEFENFGIAEGLSSLAVYSVLEDLSGQLWISTANGLFSFRPENRTFRRYDTADGLSSVEFSFGATKARGGRLLFGGLDSILTLAPARLALPVIRPPIAITGIQVLGEPRPVTDHVTLRWQENTVTFSFAVLDFRNPGKNLYAYRLDGFDREWIQAGPRHEATYTNLMPGTYHFWYKGSDPTDAWTEATHDITLDVEAAPWVRWYAWVAYAAALALVVFLVQRARLSLSLGHKVTALELVQGQLEEANRRLDQLARLDGLTGIPNRRALDLWMAEEWARAQRQQQSVALLLLDIDDFKRYNDFYGHIEGDACLKAVATTLSQTLHRTSDFCGRYGGEEFVVVLHDTDINGARIVAERLMASIDSLAIPHEAATAQPTVTLSIGVSCQVPTADRSVADLLQRADQALYRAKAKGRHRTEIG